MVYLFWCDSFRVDSPPPLGPNKLPLRGPAIDPFDGSLPDKNICFEVLGDGVSGGKHVLSEMELAERAGRSQDIL